MQLRCKQSFTTFFNLVSKIRILILCVIIKTVVWSIKDEHYLPIWQFGQVLWRIGTRLPAPCLCMDRWTTTILKTGSRFEVVPMDLLDPSWLQDKFTNSFTMFIYKRGCVIFRESRRKKIDRVPKSAGKIQNFQVLIVIIIISYRDCALVLQLCSTVELQSSEIESIL